MQNYSACKKLILRTLPYNLGSVSQVNSHSYKHDGTYMEGWWEGGVEKFWAFFLHQIIVKKTDCTLSKDLYWSLWLKVFDSYHVFFYPIFCWLDPSWFHMLVFLTQTLNFSFWIVDTDHRWIGTLANNEGISSVSSLFAKIKTIFRDRNISFYRNFDWHPLKIF